MLSWKLQTTPHRKRQIHPTEDLRAVLRTAKTAADHTHQSVGNVGNVGNAALFLSSRTTIAPSVMHAGSSGESAATSRPPRFHFGLPKSTFPPRFLPSELQPHFCRRYRKRRGTSGGSWERLSQRRQAHHAGRREDTLLSSGVR